MRGYLGHADNTTYYYAPPEKRLAMHAWAQPHFPYYMREWPTAWHGLDETRGEFEARSDVRSAAGA